MVFENQVGDAVLIEPGVRINPKWPAGQRETVQSAWERHREEIVESAGAGAIGVLTSGSTTGGIGSIIVLSQEAMLSSARAVNRRFRITETDVWGLVLPMFHVGGMAIPIRASLSGSRVVRFDGEWNVAAAQYFADRESVTLISLVPSQLFDFVSSGVRAPRKLRAAILGGARLEPGLKKAARELGWPIFESYGMTECSSQVACALTPDSSEMVLLDHVDARVDREDVLSISSSALLSSKIVVEEDGRSQFVGFEGAKWFRTSDRAKLAEQAAGMSITILGRTGELIKVLGENVDLARVRNLIKSVVAEHIANGIEILSLPDDRRGGAIVVVAESERLMEKLNLSSEKWLALLAPYERPTAQVVIGAFPRTSIGKPIALEMQRMAENRLRLPPG